MTHRRSLVHRYWQISALALLMVTLNGCGRHGDSTTEHYNRNMSGQIEMAIGARQINAILDHLTHSQCHLSGSSFQPTSDDLDAVSEQADSDSASKVDTDAKAVEMFYTLLRLPVSSRECSGE